jgi:hypothetical protein
MGAVTIALGAEIDIASGAEVDAGFAGLRERLDRTQVHNAAIRRRSAAIATGTGASGTYYNLDLGCPGTGKLWDVRSIAFAVGTDNTDPFTQSAVVFAVVILAVQPPSPSQWEPGGLVVGSLNAPWDAKFSSGSTLVRDNTHVYVWVKLTAAFANSWLFAGMSVVEADDTVAALGWVL